MSKPCISLAGLALCALLAPALPAAQATRATVPPNVVQAIGVADTAGGVELEIRGSRAPSYTVFKLQDPPRLVVDLAGADVSAVTTPVQVGRGGIREVSTAQYKDQKTSVGRVVIALEGAASYEVAPRGEALVVKVAKGDAAAAQAAPPASVAAAPAAPPAARIEPRAAASASPSGQQADGARAENVLARRVDEAEVERPATAVTGARGRAGGVALTLDGDAARFEVIELANPPRLAIDLPGVTRAPRAAVSVEGAFRRVRFGRDSDKVRVVLDAAGDLPRYEVKRVPGGLAVLAPDGVAAAEPAPAIAPRAAVPSRAAAKRVSAPEPVIRVVPEPGAEEPAPVAANAGKAGNVGAAAPAEPPRALVSDAQAAGFSGVAPSYALSGAPQKREYSGRRITLDFHDIEIRNLLRLIADVSKKNIMVADDVTGKITVSLRNVPWDQALDLILKTKGLDKEEIGNVIRIARFEEIAKEQQARAEAAKARAPLIPLKVRILPVNFARAGDVASRVKEVLSERGTITTDERTNVLIVKDTAEALARAEGLVRNLDTETPQVRIESRIVEAQSNFNRAIGVQWGGNATASAATGNPTGLFFPSTVSALGAANGLTGGAAVPPAYAVNLPAAIGQGSGGGVGFTFGSAGGAFNLNLVLSALENNGVVKTISAPSVSTVDNKEATIGQGLSIPFSQVSAAGVNTVFVEAKLELKVTPHVSADGSVLLKIKVTNNQANPQLTGANGQPSISKREAETETLVRDGETTVIGGIYTRQTSSRTSEVPFLGKIPILGFFFRNTAEQDDHTELLIFITPRVLNRQATAAAVP